MTRTPLAGSSINEHGLPVLHSPVHFTRAGTPYLVQPGFVVMAHTRTFEHSIVPFLSNYDKAWEDWPDGAERVSDGALLAKTAGQLCYLSFGKEGTPHSQAQRYIDHIKESRHGSVFEHASISFLIWGIDRAVTHEIVRHRAGFGFSQVSQRYVDKVRFVLSPEYTTEELCESFCESIDRAQAEYDNRARMLMDLNPLPADATREQKRDHRKRVNSAARRVLPNETEAPILVTANLRGWRHFIEMRDSPFADMSIRILADALLWGLQQMEPQVFGDYVPLPDGGVTTKWSKV